jgi:hypothetical protein
MIAYSKQQPQHRKRFLIFIGGDREIGQLISMPRETAEDKRPSTRQDFLAERSTPDYWLRG